MLSVVCVIIGTREKLKLQGVSSAITKFTMCKPIRFYLKDTQGFIIILIIINRYFLMSLTLIRFCGVIVKDFSEDNNRYSDVLNTGSCVTVSEIHLL